MQVDFEVFEAGPIQKSADRVHVTISKLGHIFLNRRMLEALGQPDAVTLMYDRRRSIIGVMPSTLQRAHAYPLKRKDAKTSRGRMVYAMNFCKHYGINPTETLAFTSPEINKDGILVLNLHDVTTAKRM